MGGRLWMGLGLLVLAGLLRADTARLALWGAYSQLNMNQVNTVLDGMRTDIEASGATVKSQSKLGPAWMAGLDLDWQALPWLSLGPRVEWIEGVSSVLEAENGGATMKSTNGGRLLPVALSVKASRGLAPSCALVAGAAAGWGFASVFNQAEISSTGAKSGTSRFSGSAPFSELEAALRWRLLPMLSSQVQVGWRWAFVPEMKADADESVIFKIKQGDLAKDRQGNPLPMDFSGWNAGFGLALEF